MPLIETDTEYFVRRVREERTAANQAASAEARQAHIELAARYIELAKALADHTVQLDLTILRQSRTVKQALQAELE